MFSLENFLIRILFAFFMQLVCLIIAVFGMFESYDSGKFSAFMKYIFTLAAAFFWLCIVTMLLPCFSFSHSSAGLTIYAVCSTFGVIPYCIRIYLTWKKQKKSICAGSVSGVLIVLFFCCALNVNIYYNCVENGVLSADKLFLENSIDTICRFFIFPAVLFFCSVFSLTAIIFGATGEKIYGFIKNIGLLLLPFVGLFFLTTAGFWLVNCGLSQQKRSMILLFFSLILWFLLFILPYGIMTWRGRQQKNEIKFYNGIAGLCGVNFFLLSIWILSYIGRGV